jgi:hypothetical protein
MDSWKGAATDKVAEDFKVYIEAEYSNPDYTPDVRIYVPQVRCLDYWFSWW